MPDYRQHRKRGSQSPWESQGSLYRGSSLWTEALRWAEALRHFKENGVREDDEKFILAGGKIQGAEKVEEYIKKGKRWGLGLTHHVGSSISCEVVWTHLLESRKEDQLHGHVTCSVPQYPVLRRALCLLYCLLLAFLKFLIILFLNVCFVRKVQWDNEASPWAEKVFEICMPALSSCFVHMWNLWRPKSTASQQTSYEWELSKYKVSILWKPPAPTD